MIQNELDSKVMKVDDLENAILKTQKELQEITLRIDEIALKM